jgi:site-specific recombinase XerD
MLFSEAIPKFTSWKQYDVKQQTAYCYDRHIKQFALFMKNSDIEAVTHEDVVSYLGMMTTLGWDSNSYINKCAALRGFFEFYSKQGIKVVDWELIPRPERHFKFPKVLTEETYQKLLDQIPTNNKHPKHTRNRLILNLLWDCGMRVGELCSLNISQMDTVNMNAVIKTEKAKGIRPMRQVMWTTQTNEVLKKWLVERQELQDSMEDCDPEPLFLGMKANGYAKRLGRQGVQEQLTRLSRAAKLGFTANPHSFRHAFGRDLAQKGANNSVISSLMGHGKVESSYIYTMLDNKMMDEQYTKYRRK